MANDFPVSIVLKALDKLSGPVRSMSAPFQALTGQVENLRSTFKLLQATHAETMKSLESKGKGLEKVGKKLSVAATLPLTGIGVFAIKSAGDFQEAMNNVRASTGATATDFLALRNAAIQVGSTTQYSATESAQAIAIMGRAGFSTTDILKKMPGVVSLASAANIGLADAANHVTNILEGYNVEGADSSHAVDMLAKSVYSGKGNLEDYADALSHVGPIAAGMKQPLNETLAIIASLSKTGFKGGKAGSALAGALESLREPGEGAVRTLTRLGIRASMVMDKDRNISSFVKVIDVLREHGAKSGDILSIFGAKGARAVQQLMKQGDGLKDLAAGFEDSAGAAEKFAEIQNTGFKDGFKGLVNSVSALGIAIGDSGVLDFVTAMVTKLTSLVNWLAQTNPWVLKVAFAIGAMVAAIGPLLIFLGSMLSAISVLLPVLSLLQAAFMGIGVVLLANPIGLAVTAVVAFAAAAYLVIKHWSAVKEFFASFWPWLQEKIGVFRFLIPGAGLADAFSAYARYSKASEASAKPAPAGSFATSDASGLASSLFSGGQSQSNVMVSFENMPRGVSVSSKPGDAPVDLSLGYTMVNE